MQIFVNSVNRNLLLEVSPQNTVKDVMKMIEDVQFIPSNLQALSCKGAPLCPAHTLEYSGIEETDTLKLNLGIMGGMRAKWRKKRMRRLRRKRRKMRQRAR
mmetsp:Transcript_15976/g.23703  ORF Transcript_15976/g.23703 Transcript_15976/m.23703 type:complete len:101 (-) Transcript_15976:130-432(-)